MDTLYIFLGSIGVGLLAGFLGVGGGILLVPVLTLFGDVPIKQAVGVSLLSMITTSMSSSTVYLNKDLIDLRIGIFLALSAVVGGMTGAFVSEFVADYMIALLLAAMMIYAMLSMARKQNETSGAITDPSPVRLAILMSLTFIAGNMTGLLGIGGGIVYVPLMYIGLRFPMPLAVGTSTFNVGLAATGGAVIYFLRGDLHPSLWMIPPVVVGMIAGAKLGGALGVKAKPIVTRVVFSSMLVYFCYRMIIKGVAGLQ